MVLHYLINELLKNFQKNCYLTKYKGKRKIHYTFEDRTEMAEEYNISTGDILGLCERIA